MSIDKTLLDRSGGKCELCGSDDELNSYKVEPRDEEVVVCKVCLDQINGELDESHWHCLNDSMWSEHSAVKVLSYRLLKRLGNQDLLDMIYLEEDELAWAKEGEVDESKEPTLDSNGSVLNSGDSVTIIKDLEVKGAGFTAKRGTVVKNIALTDNPEQIEGRVNGTRIVLLSKFLKKS
jgi:protein PhnA